MLGLIQELAVYEKAPDEVTVTLSHFEQSGFGENPVWWAFVAENDNTIVGFALYYIRYSTWKGQCLYLEDFIVTEKCVVKALANYYLIPLFRKQKTKAFQEWFGKYLNGMSLPLTFIKIQSQPRS